MSLPIRPCRSFLYMPGSNPKALAKARDLAADALIFDLEDAVSPSAKENARQEIIKALAEGGYGEKQLLLRVNSLATPWGHADLELASSLPLHGVVLPKVESGITVLQTVNILRNNTLGLWAMLETPLGILRAEEIAGASPRLEGILMGTADLVKELNAQHVKGREPLLYALQKSVMAARAFGLKVIDGVYLDLEDIEGFKAECLQGRQMGFDGKTLIHPKTIEAANLAFSPTPEEIARAEKIVAAHLDALAKGFGVTVVDGRLVENLHAQAALRLLEMAKSLAGEA